MSGFARFTLQLLLLVTAIASTEASSAPSTEFNHGWFEPRLVVNQDENCESVLQGTRKVFLDSGPLSSLTDSGYAFDDFTSLQAEDLEQARIEPAATQPSGYAGIDYKITVDGVTLYLRFGATPGCGGACEGQFISALRTPHFAGHDLQGASPETGFADATSLNLLKSRHGDFYVVYETDDAVEVSRLRSTPRWEVVCKIEVAPRNLHESRDEIIVKAYGAIEELLKTASAMLGEEGDCGSMHTHSRWAQYMQSALRMTLYRPWSVFEEGQQDIGIDGSYANDMRNLRLWALTGIDQYQALKLYETQLKTTTRAVAELYVARYGVSTGNATVLATRTLTAAVSAGFRFSASYEPFSSAKEGALRAAILERQPIHVIHELPLPSRMEENPYADPTDTLLSTAVEYPAALQDLLARGIDPDSVNSFGKTALMHAAQHDQIESVRILLDYDANLNLTTTIPADRCFYRLWATGTSALKYAMQYASPPVIRLLIEHGAARDQATLAVDWLRHYADQDGKDRNPRIAEEDIASLENLIHRISQSAAKDSSRSLTIAAEAAHAQGDDKHAYRLLRRALVASGADARTYGDLSLIANKVGHQEQAAEAASLLAKSADDRVAASGWFNLGLICENRNPRWLFYDGKYYCLESQLYLFLQAYSLHATQVARAKIGATFAQAPNADVCGREPGSTRTYWNVPTFGEEARNGVQGKVYVHHAHDDVIVFDAIHWKTKVYDLGTSEDVTASLQLVRRVDMGDYSVTVLESKLPIPRISGRIDCSIFDGH